MSEKHKANRPAARLPKGMRDIDASELRALRSMIETISEVYERYGFEPLDTPAFEYTDALGKFLPDTDRPNEGVFSFQDEDEQWLSLRYDLTAPLARYVAANFDALPKPFRRYSHGYVYRNEKPGPGRFRQFMQFDADTVGAASPAADAEMCMLAADTLEALGIPRGSYVIKVSNRKILDGVMEAIGLGGPENAARRLIVLRAIDKYDRLGWEGVKQLLGEGRTDESGAFTKGAGLRAREYDLVMSFLSSAQGPGNLGRAYRNNTHKSRALLDNSLDGIVQFVSDTQAGMEGVEDLQGLAETIQKLKYEGQIIVDASVVRGLEYYTGPVFEAELTFQATDEDGQPVRFGSVGGGGRYDGLVSRFRSQPVPATGFSLGVSRLYAALKHLDKLKAAMTHGPVVVTVFDKDRIADYQRFTQMLRNSPLDPNKPDGPKIRAEMYLGNPKNFGNQLKYADKRNSPCAIIQGEDERQRGEVTIKDLIEGARLSETITDNASWREGRPAQFSVPVAEMVDAVRSVLARHSA